MPVISVIIPSYGTPDRLERTVGSVLEQTFRDLEVIVVDDNNPDTDARKETEAVMEKLIASDSRVRYVKHEHNKNGSAARNTGIRAAQGEYVSLLDSDDEYTPTRLEKCLEALQKCDDPKFQGVYTGCEYRKNNATYRKMQSVKTGSFAVEYLRLEFNLFTGSNIFVSKKAADELNGFDESFTRHQDVEFMIRFFLKYSVIGLPDVLVIKNFDGKNVPSPDKLKAIKDHFLETFKPTIETLSKREQESIYGAHYAQLAERYLRVRDWKNAFRYCLLTRKMHCLNAKRVMKLGINFLRAIKKAG